MVMHIAIAKLSYIVTDRRNVTIAILYKVLSGNWMSYQCHARFDNETDMSNITLPSYNKASMGF